MLDRFWSNALIGRDKNGAQDYRSGHSQKARCIAGFVQIASVISVKNEKLRVKSLYVVFAVRLGFSEFHTDMITIMGIITWHKFHTI